MCFDFLACECWMMMVNHENDDEMLGRFLLDIGLFPFNVIVSHVNFIAARWCELERVSCLFSCVSSSDECFQPNALVNMQKTNTHQTEQSHTKTNILFYICCCAGHSSLRFFTQLFHCCCNVRETNLFLALIFLVFHETRWIDVKLRQETSLFVLEATT